ncbi:MAG: hypothetical protein KDK51_09485 [Deltaproteobacteria bacterium]|nr:hypothetical protein [Deltaproteobacteria bacterium]
MLETLILPQSYSTIDETLRVYKDMQELLDLHGPIDCIVTSNNDIPVEHVQSARYMYAFDHLQAYKALISDEDLRQHSLVFQHQEIIDAHDFTLHIHANKQTVEYPIQDSIDKSIHYILPWSAVLSEHIGATADNIQKVITRWLQTAALDTPLEWSQYRKSFWSRHQCADFTFLLTTQSVGRHSIVQSWIIQGHQMVELWYDMLQNRHHQNDFVLFTSERLRLQQPQKMIATLHPLLWEKLQKIHCNFEQIDLHSQSQKKSAPIIDLICRKNAEQMSEFRILIDGSQEQIENIKKQFSYFK